MPWVSPCTGILLVGGASRRFGSPKALARLGGETLAERGWRVLGEACDERIAVGKAADTLPARVSGSEPQTLPFPVRDDGTPVRAPIAGVVAGLRLARNEVSVFLPVDCPLVTPDLLRALAEGCLDAGVPPTGPLPGAYRRSALAVLERNLEDGRLALVEALAALRVRTVAADPAQLANVNTERELRELEARLRS
jgi:molybdenum cofactor guanylyltransferase